LRNQTADYPVLVGDEWSRPSVPRWSASTAP